MDLRLYNTLTRKKEVFRPIDPANVRMYVCGPTVYQRIHIGNARPLVVFDVLFRLLRHLYGEDKVTYVRNITDIDDKIVDQVRKDGVNGDLNTAIRDLTDGTTRAFHEDCAALGLLAPTHEPRATDHIPGMVRIIGELVAKDHAYAAKGHVLFHVPSMPSYGRLSGRSLDDMIAGARVEVAPYKRHSADFVLWKPSTPELPGWDSPWGRGRPGWHIECSAMSEALLGVPFDIHGGGQDLIFPHHENEIAQSCCAHGLDGMASIWMHNGFVDMRGEKMSKSVGNVVRAWEALKAADEVPLRRGEVLRAWLLRASYRQPVDYVDRTVNQSRQFLHRMYQSLVEVENVPVVNPDENVVNALCDDLATPNVNARLAELVVEVNTNKGERQERAAGALKASAALLGLLNHDPNVWLRGQPMSRAEITGSAEGEFSTGDARVDSLVAERVVARQQRDFIRADAIRAELHQLGIEITDQKDGSWAWRRA